MYQQQKNNMKEDHVEYETISVKVEETYHHLLIEKRAYRFSSKEPLTKEEIIKLKENEEKI